MTMTTETMIVRLAKILEEALEDSDRGFAYASYGADVCVKDAHGLVRLLLRVLREPTEAMVLAAKEHTYDPGWPEEAVKVFTAMIDAALQEKT
jgi:hypothetical protein